MLHIRRLRRRLTMASAAQEAAAHAAEMATGEPSPSPRRIRSRASVPPSATRIGGSTRISDDLGKWQLSDIDAYLIDLDGTIYNPSGPIQGAAEFYTSVLRQKPHVFLSNTGAKGADGVGRKLARNGIIMGKTSQGRHIWTAAQAQCRYMTDVIPPGARVFVIAGGEASGPGSYWMRLAPTPTLSPGSYWMRLTPTL